MMLRLLESVNAQLDKIDLIQASHVFCGIWHLVRTAQFDSRAISHTLGAPYLGAADDLGMAFATGLALANG